jgi:hypothetical protein
MFNASSSEWRLNKTPRPHGQSGRAVSQPLVGSIGSRGGVQTTVLSNNDHHPLVIEFEQEQILR